MSALDEAVEFFSPGPRARMCGDGDRADAYDAARAELSALRRRAEDAELIARAACAGRVFQRFDGHGWSFAFRFEDRYVIQFSFPDDGTGLPVLTDEARAALRGRQ